MSRVLLAGCCLTLAVAWLLTLPFGSAAVLPAATFGGLATGLQLLAVRALRRGLAGGTAEFFKGVGIGMALRLAGVLMVLVAVLADRAHFPPLPTALAYVGVVVPLLFLEVRFVR